MAGKHVPSCSTQLRGGMRPSNACSPPLCPLFHLYPGLFFSPSGSLALVIQGSNSFGTSVFSEQKRDTLSPLTRDPQCREIALEVSISFPVEFGEITVPL